MKITKSGYVLTILLTIIFILMSPHIGAVNNETKENTSNRTPVAYSSSVDQDYGFYRVIDIITNKPSKYENNTLTIYVGDTVIWQNDATPDEPLTIISEQGLWGNRSAYLRWNYQKFSYTFNQSGTYSVYVREYSRMRHQTIVVNKIPGTIDMTSTPTVILTVNPTVKQTVNATNLSTTANKTPSTDVGRTNPVPIDTILAIVGLIIIAIYISRKKK